MRMAFHRDILAGIIILWWNWIVALPSVANTCSQSGKTHWNSLFWAQFSPPLYSAPDQVRWKYSLRSNRLVMWYACETATAAVAAAPNQWKKQVETKPIFMFDKYPCHSLIRPIVSCLSSNHRITDCVQCACFLLRRVLFHPRTMSRLDVYFRSYYLFI